MSIPARIVGGWFITKDGRVSHFEEKELYVGTNWDHRSELPGAQEELIDMLESIRFDVQRPVRITSGLRTWAANTASGGDDQSLHPLGGAADLSIFGHRGWDYVPLLEKATSGGTTGRWGIYSARDPQHAHVDTDRMKTRRRWVVANGIYWDVEDWIMEKFNQAIPILEVDRREANRLLGY